MYRTIVAGYDGTDQGRDALALARTLAGGSDTFIIVASVSEEPYLTTAAGPTEWGQRLLDAARETADAARAEALLGDGAFETRGVVATSAAAGLHGLAHEVEADLLVVGSTHRGTLGRVLAGTTAERLLNGASCPVAAAPRGFAGRGEGAVRVVGVAYDGSPEAKIALDAAAELATEHRATIRVLTVVPCGVRPEYDRPRDEVEELRAAHYRAVLDDALKALPAGLRPDGRLLRGEVEPTLVEQAETGIDVMVVGSRGYGPLRRVLLGSTSTALLRAAACPLIVYPRGMDAGERLAAEGRNAAATSS